MQSSTATVATLDLNFNTFLCNRPAKSFSIPIFAISSPPIHFKCPENIDLTWSLASERSYFRLNKCFMDLIRNTRHVKSSKQFWKVMWIKWKRGAKTLNFIQKAVSHLGWTCGVRLLKVTEARQKAATFHFRWLNQLLLALCAQEL